MRLARIPDARGPKKEHLEHLSADLLWATVKRGQPLANTYVQHAKECRDCREFVGEFSREARRAGFSFPDLLPEPDRPQSNSATSTI
jgi:hypothetical protein